MNRVNTTVVLLGTLLLATGIAWAGADPDWVYISNGDKILRLDPTVCYSGAASFPGCVQTVYSLPGAKLDGLNFGPDLKLYWFDAKKARIGRITIDESGPNFTNVTFFNKGAGPTAPRAGWFTFERDLLVSDVGKVWLFPHDENTGAFGAPYVVVESEDLGTINQLAEYIDGDLVLTDVSAKSLKLSTFPQFLEGGGTANTLVSGLSKASGVAVTQGYIAASNGTEVELFDSAGVSKATCANFTGETISQLTATVSGQVYVASAKNSGFVRRIDVTLEPEGSSEYPVSCASPEPNWHVELTSKDGFSKTVGGVAVTPTSQLLSWASGEIGDLDTADDTERILAFNGSHQVRLTAAATCNAGIEAFLTPCDEVEEWIGEIAWDPNDQGEPLNDGRGVAKPFWGDNGFCYSWETYGLIGDDPVNCDPASDGDYRLRVDGFWTPANDRIGVCPDVPPAVGSCELWQLTFNFPLPPYYLKTVDPPIGGRRGSGSRDFIIGVETLDGDGEDQKKGLFCGFEAPLTNVYGDPAEPVPTFNSGRNIEIKSRLADAEVVDENDNPVPPNCQNGPFISNARILVSIARAEMGEALLVVPVQSNGTGEEDPAIMASPNNPGGLYNYGWDTNSQDGSKLPPGQYIITLTYLTDNEEPQMTMVELR